MESGVADYSKSPDFIQTFSADPARTFTAAQLIAYAVPLVAAVPSGCRIA